MKKSKTTVTMENNTPIHVYVNNTQIENAENNIYLGQRYSTRIKAIFKGNIGTCLKRDVYTSCLLQAMTYGAKIWALTTQANNKLAAAQTKMERRMLNIT